MTRERVIIGCRCGDEWLPAPAVALYAGLAVHRAVRQPGAKPWRVTHVASGVLASPVYYATASDALMALGRLTMFLDWTMSAEDVTRSDAHLQAYLAERARDLDL